MGPGTEIDLTFPATFPSGSTPDEEIAAGASIQVEVEVHKQLLVTPTPLRLLLLPDNQQNQNH